MRKGLGRHNYRSAGGPQPSLVLDFAGTGTLDPRVTFTRSTTGTYYNSSGVLTTAAINAPRFDYNPSTLAPLGLLIEQSSTNLDLYSQDFSNVIWVKNAATVTSGATTAPDGTTTGTLLVPTAISTNHYVTQVVTFTGIGTFSFYAKAKEYTAVTLSNSPNNYIHFDLTNGNISTLGTGWGSASCTPVGNGWYRCTGTNSTSQTWGQTVIFALNSFISNGNTAPTFIGNGTSGVYIWGAQLEALAFPTSYIPTTSAQVTRAADVDSMTGTNFSSWYNTAQGTFYIEYCHIAVGGNGRRVMQITSTINISDSIDVLYGIGATADGTYMNSTGVSGAINNNIITPRPTTFTKITIAFANNDYQAYASGSSAGSDTSFLMPLNMNQFSIGCNTSGSSQMSGWIKKISYYPTRLTNAQLQSLTGS